jgi:hypothetical protein
MTISKAETRQYAGAARTVVSASAGNNTYVWDQATGVSVEGNSQGADYSIHTIVEDTNMWQPSPQSPDWTPLLLAAAVTLIIAIVAVAVAVRLRKRTGGRRRGVS